ncbi:MAG TPA: RNA polymerase sigma factor [Longimicrobiales bacterium]|nr:RNA polymerase sigma factor [Longimicrobiales bacterium]
MTDKQLVERAKGGDEDAFRSLYEANVDRIYRLAYRMVGDDGLARDFTQDAFLRAWERLDQFRGDAAFSTWLHSIAVSVSLNGIRKVDRHRKRERSLEDAAHVAPGRSGLEVDARDRLRGAVDDLPEMYRTVFLMHDLEGFSHGEIAETLGVAEGTSKARLFRARAKLREALGDAMAEYVT